jgi:hypothetical protein
MPPLEGGGTSKGFDALPLPLAEFSHELTTRQVAIQARLPTPSPVGTGEGRGEGAWASRSAMDVGCWMLDVSILTYIT